MALNFPDSPSNGDTFGSFTYDSSKTVWKPTSSGGSGGASVTVSDTAPSSPSSGDLWYKSDEGQLKVWYLSLIHI